jgi:5-methylcytosine-specific restriction endonuclease McrA
MVVIERACQTCGAAYVQRHPRHLHCAEHEPHGRQHRSPSTQAQDAGYYAERRRVLTPGARCHYCPAPATTVDHVVPVARGGGHAGNLVPACTSCNASKGARLEPESRDLADAPLPVLQAWQREQAQRRPSTRLA